METELCEEENLLIHPPPPFLFPLHSLPDRILPFSFLFRPHLPLSFLLQLLISTTDPRDRTLGVKEGIGRRRWDSGVRDALMVEPVRMVRDMVF